MTILEILLAARALHAPGPETWAGRRFARDSRGRSTCILSEQVSWCMVGALNRVVGSASPWSVSWDTNQFLREACGLKSIIDFNDDPATTYEAVMAAWDRAIEKARADAR